MKDGVTFINKIRDFSQFLLSWVPFSPFFLFDSEFKQSFDRLTWGRRRMEEFELMKLKSILQFAFSHSPFYKNLYTQAGVTPDDLVTLKDIEKFPVVSKKQLRNAVIDKTIFTRDTQPIGVLKTSTSGSSGDPQVLYYDWQSRKNRFINGRRALWLMGALPEKRFLLLWRKKNLSLVQKLRSFLGLYKKISVMDVAEAQRTSLDKASLQKLLLELQKFNPQVIRGYTSSLWVIAKLIKKYNLSVRPEHVLTSAEYLPPVWHKEMEEIYKCPVHNLYGGTEASPIAASIFGDSRLTVFQDFYLSELVGKDDHSTPHGEAGRVLVTDYNNKYMPVIRYDIGDMASWDEEDGSLTFPKFKEVHGRINDIFLFPGNRVLFSHNWHVYMREAKSISRFKVVQQKIDLVDIFIELDDSSLEWNDELTVLQQTVKMAVGDGVVVNFQIVQKLEFDKGEKFRCVVSKIDPEFIIKSL